ncbi:hypothetical protein [Mycoplasma suis]|uniref:hypothetical protein n=1 Tax=Mycoplasma suis TaxID=57372 RepID=UPI00130525B4|nr:hypothetical protein [Mycoplasma suis]
MQSVPSVQQQQHCPSGQGSLQHSLDPSVHWHWPSTQHLQLSEGTHLDFSWSPEDVELRLYAQYPPPRQQQTI